MEYTIKKSVFFSDYYLQSFQGIIINEDENFYYSCNEFIYLFLLKNNRLDLLNEKFLEPFDKKLFKPHTVEKKIDFNHEKYYFFSYKINENEFEHIKVISDVFDYVSFKYFNNKKEILVIIEDIIDKYIKKDLFFGEVPEDIFIRMINFLLSNPKDNIRIKLLFNDKINNFLKK